MIRSSLSGLSRWLEEHRNGIRFLKDTIPKPAHKESSSCLTAIERLPGSGIRRHAHPERLTNARAAITTYIGIWLWLNALEVYSQRVSE